MGLRNLKMCHRQMIKARTIQFTASWTCRVIIEVFFSLDASQWIIKSNRGKEISALILCLAGKLTDSSHLWGNGKRHLALSVSA